MEKFIKLLFILVSLVIALFLFSYKTNRGRSLWYPYYVKFFKKSVSDRLLEFTEPVRDRLKKDLDRKGLVFPPKKMSFLALKHEKKFELWASNQLSGKLIFVKEYDFTSFSGQLGPKLKEGDRQIPEGFYKIKSLNPNSSYHLSLEVNYPNEFDLKYAKQEGRTEPGSLIYIHGKNVTIGCIPLGDEAIEEIFVLTALVGLPNIDLTISPKDFRLDSNYKGLRVEKKWIYSLYDQIISIMQNKYKK